MIAHSAKSWSREEDDTIISLRATNTLREIAERIPGRNAEAVKTRLSVLRKLGYAIEPKLPKAWTRTDDLKLKYAWGRLSEDNLKIAFPGRSYAAITNHAAAIGLGPPDRVAIARRTLAARMKRPDVWTAAEIETAIANKYNRKMWPTLLPGRSTRSIEYKLNAVIGVFGQENARKLEELQVAESIIRQEQKLLTTRSLKAVQLMLDKMRKFEIRRREAKKWVEAACSWIVQNEIRSEVQADLLVQILANKLRLDELGEASRKARTAIYGRRMYSLDSPLGDGSGRTWIDNLDSEQEHF